MSFVAHICPAWAWTPPRSTAPTRPCGSRSGGRWAGWTSRRRTSIRSGGRPSRRRSSTWPCTKLSRSSGATGRSSTSPPTAPRNRSASSRRRLDDWMAALARSLGPLAQDPAAGTLPGPPAHGMIRAGSCYPYQPGLWYAAGGSSGGGGILPLKPFHFAMFPRRHHLRRSVPATGSRGDTRSTFPGEDEPLKAEVQCKPASRTDAAGRVVTVTEHPILTPADIAAKAGDRVTGRGGPWSSTGPPSPRGRPT